jgi:hypothetical protein
MLLKSFTIAIPSCIIIIKKKGQSSWHVWMIKRKPNRMWRRNTPAMLYKVVKTTISGVRVPNNAWPAHLQKIFYTFKLLWI